MLWIERNSLYNKSNFIVFKYLLLYDQTYKQTIRNDVTKPFYVFNDTLAGNRYATLTYGVLKFNQICLCGR